MADLARLAETDEYLTFRIAGEDCAIAILSVQEAIRYEAVIRVPGTPPSILGVINLRGRVVPVMDLAVKFGLPRSRATEKTCIILVDVLLDGKGAVMGVLADRVSGVEEFSTEEMGPPPLSGCRVGAPYVLGVGKVGGGRVLILDMDRILSSDEAIG